MSNEVSCGMQRKVCLITGATSGIGKATAIELGRLCADLILVGRNERAGRRIADKISKGGHSGTVEFIRTDLSALAEVRSLAAKVNLRYNRIDILINNAGARFNTYGRTADGLERTFATNHLSHFLLTCLLLDRLMSAPAARVITVASGSHSSAKSDGCWQFGADNYDRRMTYAKSKLANILFAFELANRLKATRVTSNAVDPGGVASNFARNNGLVSWLKHLLSHSLRRELVSPRTGAEAVLYLAAGGDGVEGISGRYFHRKQEMAPAAVATDPDTAHQLWALSVQLSGLNQQIGSAWSHIQP